MAALNLSKAGSTKTLTNVHPLESGDRLTRVEFERAYDAMPGLKKAELIEGVVYMPSPARYESHGDCAAHVDGCVVRRL